MNLYQRHMMDKPSMIQETCIFCGSPATEGHHVIPKSQGGKDGPVISVCGWGNTCGCHGLIHQHKLHVRWADVPGCWSYLRTPEPMKEELTYSLPGWVLTRKILK